MPSISGAPSGPSPTPSGSNSATYSDNGVMYSPHSRDGARSPSSPRYSSHEQAFNASPPMGPMVSKRAPPQHAIAETIQGYSEPSNRARENSHAYNDRHEQMDEREKWRRDREREKESYRETPETKYPSSRYPANDDERTTQARNVSPVQPTVTVQQPPSARNGPPSPIKSKERERQERHARAREREEQREKSKREKEIREEKGEF
jgi:hypothetical protein